MKLQTIEELNEEIYSSNSNELNVIFNDALNFESGNNWVSGNVLVNNLSRNGYILVKVEVKI